MKHNQSYPVGELVMNHDGILGIITGEFPVDSYGTRYHYTIEWFDGTLDSGRGILFSNMHVERFLENFLTWKLNNSMNNTIP